jgi:hypothetical protein
MRKIKKVKGKEIDVANPISTTADQENSDKRKARLSKIENDRKERTYKNKKVYDIPRGYMIKKRQNKIEQ